MTRTRFSISTFNAKNLVNPETNYYQKPNGEWNRYSETAFKRKTDWMAHRLADMDADHVCLQEVFHEEALQQVAETYNRLIANLQLNQTPYTEVIHFHNIHSQPEDPSPGLGYLGRKPVESARQIQDLSEKPVVIDDGEDFHYSLNSTSRPFGFVEFDMGDGRRAVLVNAHLKSKRPLLSADDPASDADELMFYERHKGQIGSLLLRSGEALALRRELLLILKGTTTPLFMAGDLNDSGRAVTTEVIRGEAPWRFEPNFETKKGFWDVELHSAANDHLRRSEQADFVTHIYNGHHSTIDHVFYSEQFYYRASGNIRIGDLDYARVFNDQLTDSASSNWTPYEQVPSDHGQVVAYFSLYETDEN